VNHIKQLQAENETLKESLKTAHDSSIELWTYLASEKFQGERGFGGSTYVNKDDVFHRLAPIIGATCQG